ncbi:MAG TPA: c-type cytochrome [Candidatus Limnocylindria bacterium]
MRTARSLALATLALAALTALLAGLAVARSDPAPLAGPVDAQFVDPDPMGADLYQQSCASCHGTDGAGTEYAPTLLGVGAASVDFQLSTGRMPFAGQAGQQAKRKPVAFTQEQIDSLVEYVVDLGGEEPPGPAIPSVTLSDELLSRGQEIFAGNCAPCHGATGNGGAVGGGALAPPLDQSTPVQTVEAMLSGPGQMPVFALSGQDEDAVATYVDYLQSAPSPGGFSIGGIGPVPEGFVSWVVGMGGLLVVVILVGREWRRPEGEQ